MKLIVAALLIAIATPAAAAVSRPADRPDIARFVELYGVCVYRSPEKYGEAAHAKACADSDTLRARLEKRGYCIYGKGAVGKRGKRYYYPGFDKDGTNAGWRYHCFELTR